MAAPSVSRFDAGLHAELEQRRGSALARALTANSVGGSVDVTSSASSSRPKYQAKKKDWPAQIQAQSALLLLNPANVKALLLRGQAYVKQGACCGQAGAAVCSSKQARQQFPACPPPALRPWRRPAHHQPAIGCALAAPEGRS